MPSPVPKVATRRLDNEIRDLTAHLLTEVCHNVAVEPHLQPLTGETLHGMAPLPSHRMGPDWLLPQMVSGGVHLSEFS